VAAVNAATFGASSRADPARPVQTLPLPGILPPPVGSRYTKATRETLLNSGLALMDYATDGTCTILRQVTTYQKNSAGAPDTSYLDAETLFTLAAVVRQQSADLSNAFPRAKLADNGTNFGAGMTFSAGAPDQPITTPNGIRAEIIASYSRMMEDKAWVQDLDGFIAGLTVQRNSTDASRVDVMETLYIVSGVRILAVKVGFSLF
jgi:phage tail sheath gpL-like